ncbi:hypothetical protein ACVIIY_002087 [Bradyrhizobium sp. USDA 4515]
MAYQIPANIRPILARLADVIVPIADWINQAGKAPPKCTEFIPALANVPWRPAGAAPSLSINDFDIVAYLEYRAKQDEPLEPLAARWRQVRANPTAFFKSWTGEQAAAWRARRANLNAAPRFGAFESTSSNFGFYTQDAQGNPKDAISREGFYDACWGPLEDAHKASNPDANGWPNFASRLRSDGIQAWPSTRNIRSSLFVRQFTIDILVAILGQKNPAASSKGLLWPRAILIEAGENRQPSNAYTVAEAATAVQHF